MACCPQPEARRQARGILEADPWRDDLRPVREENRVDSFNASPTGELPTIDHARKARAGHGSVEGEHGGCFWCSPELKSLPWGWRPPECSAFSLFRVANRASIPPDNPPFCLNLSHSPSCGHNSANGWPCQRCGRPKIGLCGAF